MCGIGGIIASQGSMVDMSLLETMGALQTHRGPDDQGSWQHDNAGLTFQRLAIIDLSPAGHQPMSNETGDVWLAFNGEIYNYAPLQEDLAQRGHQFRSHSDSEVIIHAYEEFGDDCVSHFNGMFAFAIWDMRRQRLLLARDRMGVKPLYYHQSDQHIVFASEIKAVLVGAGLRPQPNDSVIFDYLSRARVDHTDATFFSGIYQLPAAHVGVFERGALSLRRYWDIPTADQANNHPTPTQINDYADEFLHLLTDSIRLRLRSDVPIGTCLSGGLDSSAIVCIANTMLREGATGNSEALSTQQKTFSARYHNFTLDEGPFIDTVAQAAGTDSHSVYPEGTGLVEDLPALLWFQEQPFGSTSIYAQWNVMRLARQNGVTVLLDGQGSDEQLAGYYRYFGASFADLVRRNAYSELLREVAIYRGRGYPTRQAALGAAVALVGSSWTARKAWSRVSSHLAPAWLDPHFRNSHRFYQLPSPRCAMPFDETLYRAMTSESLPALLRYEDRNSMAFSIEARVPFLDYRLIEFIFSLPRAAKLHAGVTKVVMRRALRNTLPASVLQRRDKVGFATPQDRWLRGPAQPLANDIITSSTMAQRGYVDAKRIGELWRGFQAGDSRHGDALWRCINMELWCRHMIDTPGWYDHHPWGTTAPTRISEVSAAPVLV